MMLPYITMENTDLGNIAGKFPCARSRLASKHCMWSAAMNERFG